MSDDHNLNIAQLAIYAILILPTLYVLIRHSLPGLLGWLYLAAFCMLRIVGAGLALSNGPTDKTAAIISSIGLSPLLLAVSGVLHEARHYRNPSLARKVELILVLLYHIFVTTGLALLASGSSAFSSSTNNPNKSDENLLKVGIVILLLSWVMVYVWGLFSLLPSQGRRDAPAYSLGTKLLYATLFALPFVGMRMMYSTISILAPSKNLSPVNAALGLRLGLSFIPELIAVIGFVVVGILTRNVRRAGRGDRMREVDVRMVRMESERGKDGEVAGRRLMGSSDFDSRSFKEPESGECSAGVETWVELHPRIDCCDWVCGCWDSYKEC
ncbi:uncharacterized protein PAC_01345 [Phialocephala subalpina]|uniref:DUF7702 domain-containing protein n=1 Tax=Phialocephala subalpina TaxID=576137 RepID=A0A1L7WFF4_9HELO|nr:uncharacterized protein PAC_01345 [Phialocephala subalpina]